MNFNFVFHLPNKIYLESTTNVGMYLVKIVIHEYALLDKKEYIHNLPINAFRIRIRSAFSIQIIYSCYIHHNIYLIHFPLAGIYKHTYV